MNPFANAVCGFDKAQPIPHAQPVPDQTETAEDKAKSKKKAEDRKERAKALETTQVREWELDYGNGAISDEDKATFT